MFRAHLHQHLSHFLGHRPLKSSKWFTSRFSPSLSISSKPCQEARCRWLFKLSFVHLYARSSFKVAASLLDRNCSLNSGIYFSVRSISFMPARWSSLPSGASVIMFVLKTSSLLTFSLFVVSSQLLKHQLTSWSWYLDGILLTGMDGRDSIKTFSSLKQPFSVYCVVT